MGLDPKWEEPAGGYTDVFTERDWRGTPEYCVNRIGRYVGDSHTVVWCPTREAAEAAHRLLTGYSKEDLIQRMTELGWVNARAFVETCGPDELKIVRDQFND